jgi:hypothetical protein
MRFSSPALAKVLWHLTLARTEKEETFLGSTLGPYPTLDQPHVTNGAETPH